MPMCLFFQICWDWMSMQPWFDRLNLDIIFTLPLQASALPTSGDIAAGNVCYLKGALRIQTAIAVVVACAQLGLEDWPK